MYGEACLVWKERNPGSADQAVPSLHTSHLPLRYWEPVPLHGHSANAWQAASSSHVYAYSIWCFL